MQSLWVFFKLFILDWLHKLVGCVMSKLRFHAQTLILRIDSYVCTNKEASSR